MIIDIKDKRNEPSTCNFSDLRVGYPFIFTNDADRSNLYIVIQMGLDGGGSAYNFNAENPFVFLGEEQVQPVEIEISILKNVRR